MSAGTARDKCSKGDILVAQSPGSSAGSNGETSYEVEIVNKSPTGTSIFDIHLSCGLLSSTGVINPKIIKRLSFNDCLVNGGQPLRAGLVLSFTYTSTVRYDLSVSSIQC